MSTDQKVVDFAFHDASKHVSDTLDLHMGAMGEIKASVCSSCSIVIPEELEKVPTGHMVQALEPVGYRVHKR